MHILLQVLKMFISYYLLVLWLFELKAEGLFVEVNDAPTYANSNKRLFYEYIYQRYYVLDNKTLQNDNGIYNSLNERLFYEYIHQYHVLDNKILLSNVTPQEFFFINGNVWSTEKFRVSNQSKGTVIVNLRKQNLFLDSFANPIIEKEVYRFLILV